MTPRTSSRTASRLGAGVTALALVAGLQVLVAAQPASAQTAGSCSGSVTGHPQQLKTRSGTVVGEIIVYYQSASGGTNTACLYHRGPAYGVTTPTMVQLGECQGRDCTYAFDSSFMRDSGNYARYAGPVRRTTTNANCVIAEGSMIYRGEYILMSSGKVGCP